jgi:anti-anti-sigma regulatory factor
METVGFIDSGFLEYLLDLQERLNALSSQVKFVHVGENVAKILEITRLGTAFEQCLDVAEAVKTI